MLRLEMEARIAGKKSREEAKAKHGRVMSIREPLDLRRA